MKVNQVVFPKTYSSIALVQQNFLKLIASQPMDKNENKCNQYNSVDPYRCLYVDTM